MRRRDTLLAKPLSTKLESAGKEVKEHQENVHVPKDAFFCIWQANTDKKEKQKSGFKGNKVQNVELEGSYLSRKTKKSIRQIKRLTLFLLKLIQLQVSTSLQEDCMMKNFLEIFSGMASIWWKMPQELACRNIHPPKIPQKANVLEPYR